MAGNMAWGLLTIACFAMLLFVGHMIGKIPEIIVEWRKRREFKAWLRDHNSSRSYFLP